MSLYEPEIEKQKVQKIRAVRKKIRQEKARLRKEKREKYKTLFKEELAKERARLQAQKEKDVDAYKSKKAVDKAHRQARARVKPFTPKTSLKIRSKRLSPEQKRKLKKAGIDTGKTVISLGKSGMKLLDEMFGAKPTYKKRSTKRKTTKRKTTKRKGKTYYCRKCKARHSYTSKIGRKHRPKTKRK